MGNLTIACDLHVHSFRSTCGFHTHLEIVEIVKKKNLKACAVTDHGPTLTTPRAYFSVLLRRLPKVIDGVRVFKGIEASILNTDGDIDLPEIKGHSYEIILAGLHNHDDFDCNPGIEKNTEAVLNAMQRNPEIAILTHPYYDFLPLDLDAVTDAVADLGIALEVNNSYITTGKANMESLAHMLDLAGKKGAKIAVNSDGHVFNEIGEFGAALSFMERYGFDPKSVVNRTLESTLDFLGLEE